MRTGRHAARTSGGLSRSRLQLALAPLILSGACAATAWAQPQPAAAPGAAAAAAADTTLLASRLDIARLLDLAAQRTAAEVRYDPASLKGTVTIRSEDGLDDAALWRAAQRALVTAGFTTVRRPGETILDVVKLSEARTAARVERDGRAVVADDASNAPAGYAVILIKPAHLTPEVAATILKSIASQPAGTAEAFGDGQRLLLADLRPNLEQMIDILGLVDVPRTDPAILTVPVQHQDPARLAQSVTTTATQADAIAGRQRVGKLTPTPDGRGVLLVAPPAEQAAWLALVRTFDVPAPIVTRSYVPEAFGTEEVAGLLEQIARDPGPRGSGTAWRVVTDDLTGTLVVTATAVEHEAAAALLDRLEAVPPAARRNVQSFTVRNRDVNEVLDLLGALLDVGAFDAGDATTTGVGPDGAATDASAGTGPGSGSSRRGRSGVGNQRSLLEPAGTAADRNRDAAPGRSTTPAGSRRSGTGSAAASGGGGGRGAGGSGTGTARRLADDELTLTVDTATSTIIAVGPRTRLDQIAALIADLDVRSPQVMIEVLGVSLSDQDFLDLGIELEKIELAGSTSIDLSSLFGLASRSGSLDPARSAAASGFTGIAIGPGDFSVVVRALQTINQGRTLVMPKLLVNNNEEAFFDSVLQEPVQSTNASDTVATTSFSGTQDAGTSVNIVPYIAEGDHLVLDYEVEQSAFIGDSATPTLPPPRQSNRLASVITIPDGHTIIVGGFENRVSSEAESKVPLLGDIPLLGELFTSRSRTDTTSRFYVFIRATVLRHDGFEDLRYLSRRAVDDAGANDEVAAWPTVTPLVIVP